MHTRICIYTISQEQFDFSVPNRISDKHRLAQLA